MPVPAGSEETCRLILWVMMGDELPEDWMKDITRSSLASYTNVGSASTGFDAVLNDLRSITESLFERYRAQSSAPAPPAEDPSRSAARMQGGATAPLVERTQLPSEAMGPHARAVAGNTPTALPA